MHYNLCESGKLAQQNKKNGKFEDVHIPQTSQINTSIKLMVK